MVMMTTTPKGEIEHLRQEVRRLKSHEFSLEEEKEDLLRRYTFVCQELERTRAVPGGAKRPSVREGGERTFGLRGLYRSYASWPRSAPWMACSCFRQ